MNYIIIFLFFLYGIIFGSFFGVVGYRVPNKKSIVKPRSHCSTCKHMLGLWDLVPIFSYILSGGKCRYCKTHISIFYPLVELLTGIIFVICYLVFGLSTELIVALTFVSMLICIIISDIYEMIIPDIILFIGSVLILVQKLVFSGFSIFTNNFLNGFILFIVMLLIKLIGDFVFKKECLGGGDVKLMFPIGIIIGWKVGIFSIFVASVIALPASLFYLLIKKKRELPFGPFLSLAAVILYFMQINISDIINILYNI